MGDDKKNYKLIIEPTVPFVLHNKNPLKLINFKNIPFNILICSVNLSILSSFCSNTAAVGIGSDEA